jgi:uroporphyrinogen decarboxylase
MTAHSLYKLRRHLGLSGNMKVFEPYQYVAHIDEDLKEAFAIDTDNLTPEPDCWAKRLNPAGHEVLLPEKWVEETGDDGTTVVRRADGVVAARRAAGGYYFDPVNPVLEEVNDAAALEWHRETILSFDLPSFADESPDNLRRRASAMRESGRCAVLNLCCHILAAGQLLRGYENFMVDLLTNELLVRTLLDLLMEGYLSRIDQMAPVLRGSIDVVLLNDDLGTQNGPMLAPAVYRRLIKPYQATLFQHAKRSFGAKLLFHSCGAVRDFIPDLIEVGVDALNPVQISADGMDPKALKRDFGGDLTFWGGGMDTQSVLNRKGPAEVGDAVRRNVDILAPGGGFVFCQVHNIQPDVPPENVVAMYRALDEYGLY